MLGDQLASMSVYWVAENASGFSKGAGRFHKGKGWPAKPPPKSGKEQATHLPTKSPTQVLGSWVISTDTTA
jgi:hypothetical protein